MTLKQKFSRILPWYSEKDNSNKSNECEKIADDYAIGFFEWALCNQDMEFEYDNHTDGLKKLLEIFKKEKGL